MRAGLSPVPILLTCSIGEGKSIGTTDQAAGSESIRPS